MNLHGNAKTTPYTRELMVRRVLEQAEPVRDTAEALGVSPQTVYKWLRRYRERGLEGLQDVSSRPHSCPTRTPEPVVRKILKLRRHRLTAWQIAQRLSMPTSTVARCLQRAGLGRLKVLDPQPPVRRYERKRPGELLHIDTKKLAKIVKPGHRIHGDRSRSVYGAGWEHAHVAVDDHTRVAFVFVLANEGQYTCTEFLLRAIAFYRQHGVKIERVMTDNGNGYRSKRFNEACRELGIRHIYTKPYTPRTNGKAERFIRTLKEKWAYARCYRTSARRTRALTPWLNHYNNHRPHAGIGMRPPIARLSESCEQRA
jgi:transposase InsO family protein